MMVGVQWFGELRNRLFFSEKAGALELIYKKTN